MLWCWSIIHSIYFVSISADYLQSFSRWDTELSIRQRRNPEDQRRSEELESDCSVARRRCREEPRCSAAHWSFQRACQAAADTCTFPLPAKCLLAWRELSKTVLGKCTCSEPLQARCIQIWKETFNNPCLQYSQESQASGASGDGSDDDYNADVEGEKNLVTDTGSCSSMNAFVHSSNIHSLWKRFSCPFAIQHWKQDHFWRFMYK